MVKRGERRAAAGSKLRTLVGLLKRRYKDVALPPPRTPFEWVLWENVAYLVNDERRLECYRALEKRAGLTAEKLASASRETLLAIAARGGMHPEKRVDKLLDCAEIAQRHGGGDLTQILALPLPKARKILREFPGIGAPGAEKILMACGASTELALESNALRCLIRIGYGRHTGNYARDYRSVQKEITREIVREPEWLLRAHVLLRAHGQTLCVREMPECEGCPVVSSCVLMAPDGAEWD